MMKGDLFTRRRCCVVCFRIGWKNFLRLERFRKFRYSRQFRNVDFLRTKENPFFSLSFSSLFLSFFFVVVFFWQNLFERFVASEKLSYGPLLRIRKYWRLRIIIRFHKSLLSVTKTGRFVLARRLMVKKEDGEGNASFSKDRKDPVLCTVEVAKAAATAYVAYNN